VAGGSAQGEEITHLLESASGGDAEAFDRVFQVVYDELRRLARQVRRGRASETLNTTALVHEAYVRLLPSRDLAWEGRSHFMAVAARAMRQVLVRAAERRATAKRGGDKTHVPLDDTFHRIEGGGSGGVDPERILALDAALGGLERLNARQARVVECRFFAGLSVEETARALDVSEPTVKRDWSAARAFLARELSAG
jgi:RNA polymerase sigma factor (TIGR02999 family)